MTPESLKPAEAAVVAHVDVRDVNRVIDERILPGDLFGVDDGRRVLAVASFLISFYFDSANRLTSEERLRTIAHAGVRLKKFRTLNLSALVDKDWIVRHDFLTIDLVSYVRRAGERMDRLTAARNLVVSDPEILGGTPVLRGTRIPVHDVAASVTAGIPIDRILAAYPALDRDKIELAAIYAAANPVRGRPRTREGLPRGVVVVSDRTTPRRRKAG